MKLYAHIADGAVRELISLADDLVPGKDVFTAAFAAAMVDITAASPQPVPGWSYDGKAFAPPVAPSVDLKAYAAAARYARETAGITVGGVKVATDEGSQAKIGNAYVLLQASGASSIDFKGSDGAFATLTVDQFKALALAVGAYVQACFAAEAQVDADIASGKVTTAAQVDAAFAAVTA